MALIYVVRNRVNGKAYIGQTRKTLAIRWSNHRYSVRNGSQHFLHKAIRKYGEESFEVSELIQCDPDRLNQLEKLFIALFETTKDALGYNQTFGGEGGVPTLETLAKKSGPNHFNFGKHLSEETRLKIGAGNKGKIGPRLGYFHTPESRKKISDSRKAKTHCKNGHLLSGDNLIIREQGKRQCRICVRERSRAYMKARRLAYTGSTGAGTVYTPVSVS